MRGKPGRRVIGTVLGLAATAVAAGAAAADDPLAGYRWKSRVLVVAAPDASSELYKAQREALASVAAGRAERDLVTVEAVGGGAQAKALRQRFGLLGTGFRAILVGKDGGVKLSSDKPIPPQTLFATIDAMPMRQDEMKRR